MIAACVLATAGCGGGDGRAAADPVTVLGAASLTEVLPRVGADARFSFAGSNELATQLRQGAPADVFASASRRYPDELHAEGLVEAPRVFASNRLVLVVPPDDPAGIDSVDDLAAPGVKLVVAAAGVPVGDYTVELLEELGRTDVLARVVSREPDVKGVVGKVALGEADAGVVYATDAAAAGDDVRVVELPAGPQPRIEYAVAVVSGSDSRAAAERFVDRLLGEQGRAALREAGFDVP